MPLHFKIVAPERLVYEDAAVDSVTLMTTVGEITILPHHIPLTASLRAGELLVKKGSEVLPMAISGGLVEVQAGSRVTVLADSAELVEEIDEVRAEEARQRAATVMSEKRDEQVDFTALAAKMEKELARVKVARKYRHIRTMPPSN
jgi:F-type H+-transporting ATPase subunit epsilon